jgi:hypothetical protein
MDYSKRGATNGDCAMGVLEPNETVQRGVRREIAGVREMTAGLFEGDRSRGCRVKKWGLRGERRNTGAPRDGARNENGAVLVLALVFLIAVGGIITALATWGMNDLNNTGEFTAARTLQYGVSSATEVAIQNIRYTPLWSTQTAQNATPSQPTSCWGSGQMSDLTTNGEDVAVWCSTVWTPLSANTRTVTLSACPVTASEEAAETDPQIAASCASNPTLQANVTFGDYPPNQISPPTTGECAVYCGTTMTVNSWLWGA